MVRGFMIGFDVVRRLFALRADIMFAPHSARDFLRHGVIACMAAVGLAAPAHAATYFTAAPPSGVTNPISAQSIYTTSSATMSGATTYATQSIYQTSGGGTFTIPAGLAVTVLPSDATVAESNGLLTITLPLGVSFTSVPTVTLLTSTSTATTTTTGTTTTTTTTTTSTNVTNFTDQAVPIRLVGSGAISPAGNKLVYTLRAGIAKKNTIAIVQLSTFGVTGASGLSSPGGTLQVTAQISGFVTNAAVLNDARPIEGTLAIAASGVTASMVAGPGDSIALTDAAIATRFNSYDLSSAQGAVNGPTILGRVANLGSVSLAPATAQDATGANVPYTATSTGTLVANGLFANYAGAWLSSGSTCATETRPADALPGTVTTTAVTIPNVPLASTAQAICVQASGTSALSPTGPISVTFTIGGQSQGVTPSSAIRLDYAGTSFRVPIILTGANANRPRAYIRIVNTTNGAADIYGIIKTEGGTTFPAKVGTVGAQRATLISHESVIAQLGASAAIGPNSIASATFFTPAPALGQSIPGYTPGNASGVAITSIQLANSGKITNLE
jgi:hypothetical protein